MQQDNSILATRRARTLLLVLVLALVLGVTALAVSAGTPLSVAGYADFSYGGIVKEEPTAKAAESKLWYNADGWWGILYNPTAQEYRIYLLNATTQEWVDTGVPVDDREESRADVLWAENEQKLYVVSHIKKENPSKNGNPDNWARLYRYSYDAGANTYALDAGFPVTVNESVTESVVMDRDSTGRLWITYVTREIGTDVYQVYVNYSMGDDQTWGAPFVLPMAQVTVHLDDIATLLAFEDNSGPKVGVLWSNQLDGNFYFATHADAENPTQGWAIDPNFNAAVPYSADDHMHVDDTASGQVLMVVKTSAVAADETLIGVIARAANGTYSTHQVSPVLSQDTRPTMVIDESANKVYVFTVSKTDGGQICYEAADIPSPLSALTFQFDNCAPPQGELPEIAAVLQADAPVFIGDAQTYVNINNPTSTKQRVTADSGIVVLASDDFNGSIYVHNSMGVVGPPPPGLDDVTYLPLILNE